MPATSNVLGAVALFFVLAPFALAAFVVARSFGWDLDSSLIAGAVAGLWPFLALFGRLLPLETRERLGRKADSFLRGDYARSQWFLAIVESLATMVGVDPMARSQMGKVPRDPKERDEGGGAA